MHALIKLSITAAIMGGTSVAWAGCPSINQTAREIDPVLQVIYTADPEYQNIYFCKADNAPQALIKRFTETNIVPMRAISLGGASATADITASQIDVSQSSNIPAITNSVQYNSKTDFRLPLGDVYNFYSYGLFKGDITGNARKALRENLCRSHHTRIRDYLRNNPQMFIVNDNASLQSSNVGNDIAKGEIIDEQGRKATITFYRSNNTAGQFYSKFFTSDLPSDYEKYIERQDPQTNVTDGYSTLYCMVSVGIKAEFDLNTAKAGAHRIDIGIQPQ
ncbi:hypothetical protein LU293_06785 [Moraxella nasovis]|uniref:hypothetical protein n=1 Tax=Moraxella nasovis TaxID=2904121 RepID=UPI001F615D9E|nr:hypothetical protein [Moraxella nasovis]UNU72808.1 hypothetical protein LU293_06785 [Moraxella nasovis]